MTKLMLRIVLLGPLLLLVLVVAGWLALPWPVLLRWRNPDTTSLMRYRIHRSAEDMNVRHEWVPLKDVSPHLVRAVVLAEDGRFREHGGIDWHALAEEVRYDGEIPLRLREGEDWAALADALRYGWEHRGELRGRSTITQQLAKNLYYTPERSLARKLGELFVARRLEWFLDKDRILEIYLNTVELGPGIFGAEAAAREYFGTSAADLGMSQAAALAATLPHPLTSNPGHRPGRMAWRRDLILARMRGGATADRSPIPEAPPEVVEPEAPDLSPERAADSAAAADTPAADTAVPAADTGGAPPPDTTPPDTTRGTELAPRESPDTTSEKGGGR